MNNTSSAAQSNAELAGAFQNRAPAEVRWALKLLWLSLALSVANTLSVPFKVYVLGGQRPTSLDFTLIILFVEVAGALFSAFLNIMIARGKNWARIMLLIISVAIIARSRVWLTTPSGYDTIRTATIYGLDWTAMYLLFFTPGRRWFRHTSSKADD